MRSVHRKASKWARRTCIGNRKVHLPAKSVRRCCAICLCVTSCLVSERRTLFHETDEIVNRKVRAAHEATLRPIVCVGETLEQRDRGNVEKILAIQLRGSLKDLSEKELLETVIAYEPVWAIGTGRNATPAQAQEAHAFIRHTLREMSDETTADRIRIQYGGSVKPDNARELMSQPDIDGALVGGASLDPRSFAQIVQAARGEG